MPNWVRIISVAVFVASFVSGMGLVSWHEIGEVRNDTLLTTLIAIIVKGEAVSVAIAGAGYSLCRKKRNTARSSTNRRPRSTEENGTSRNVLIL